MLHRSTFHVNGGDVILFKNWVLSGPKETYLSCLLLACLGIAYQGIRFARQQYGRRCHNLHCKRFILNKGHLLQTALYVLQFVWGYFLMLAVMTFNAWILVAVLAGFGLGYFFFGWGEFEDRKYFKPSSHPSHTCGDGSGLSRQLLSPSMTSSSVSHGADSVLPSSSSRMACSCNDTTPL